MSDDAGRILVVDDVPENVRLLEAVLDAHGYDVVSATDGQAALDLALSAKPDLVLLDVMMPHPDGRRLQAASRRGDGGLAGDHAHGERGVREDDGDRGGRGRLPLKAVQSRRASHRIRSLLRIKRYHDTIKAQAAELLELNRTLEERVQTQLEELGRLQRLRRFLSPQLADALVSSARRVDPAKPPSAGRDVLRRPSRLDELRRCRRARGADARARRVPRHDRRSRQPVRGDGRLHRGRRRPALLQRSDRGAGSRVAGSSPGLCAQGRDGRADGPLAEARFRPRLRRRHRARLCDLRGGRLSSRSDYAAIGAVTNLASRLADEAAAGQILISQRLYAEVEDDVDVESAGEFTLKGFQRTVAAFNVIAIREPAAELYSVQSE